MRITPKFPYSIKKLFEQKQNRCSRACIGFSPTGQQFDRLKLLKSPDKPDNFLINLKYFFLFTLFNA